jgi:uncharacterized protein (DUF433 family)
MAGYIWRANPKLWSNPSDLDNYISDPSRYVYWSTPQHRQEINIGDDAFIYLSNGKRAGVVAVGKVVELPRRLSHNNQASFAHPTRLPASGWNESNAPSEWKTGIEIRSVHLDSPLSSPKPRGRQTVERVCASAPLSHARYESTTGYRSIITIEPDKRGGRPCIRGMRIAVADILGWLAAGMSHEEILADYPELTEHDIRAALAYAADRERRVVTAAE